jgi:hypothetical protein
VYVQRVAAPRPSNAAIQALQAENRRLRRLLEFNKIDVQDGVMSPDVGSGGEREMTSPEARIQALRGEGDEIGMLIDSFAVFVSNLDELFVGSISMKGKVADFDYSQNRCYPRLGYEYTQRFRGISAGSTSDNLDHFSF